MPKSAEAMMVRLARTIWEAAGQEKQGNDMAADERDLERWREQHYQQWNDELAARRTAMGGAVLPELRGTRVRLRALEPGDETQLYLWASDEHERWLWREEPGLTGFERFCEHLRQAHAANEPHLIVEGLHSGRMTGWVYADLLSLAHQRCRMHVYVIPEARSYGAGAEAGILFLDYLFGWLGMRKVIAEMLAAREDTRTMVEHWGFQVEGVFKEERWLGGQPHDVARLAILRAAWEQTSPEAPEQASLARASHMPRLSPSEGLFFPDGGEPQHL